MKQIIAYVRVSTNRQDYQRQIENIEKSPWKPDQWFTDKFSGTTMTREGWEKCNATLRERDILVVSELDRLGRSMGQVFSALEDLKSRGVTVACVKLGMDSENPSWLIVTTVMAMAAQMERDAIVSRTKEGREIAKRNGVKFGRPKEDHSQKKQEIERLREKGFTAKQTATAMGMTRARLYQILKEA